MKRHTTFLIVFLTVFLDLLGFGIIIPIFPFISKEFGASGAQLGMLMASYSIMQFFFAPVWGRLSDRIGRKPIILISLVGSTTGMVLFALANSLTWLFVSRILAGMAAANISTAQAIMADITPPEQRTRGMGMVGAAIGLGFVFGPGLSFLLVQGNQYAPVFWFAAALSACDFLMALIFLPETLSPEGSSELRRRGFSFTALQHAFRMPLIPRLLCLSLLYYIAFTAMESTFGYYIESVFSMTAKQNGFILFLVGLMMALVQGGLVSRLTKRWGDPLVLRSGIAGIVIGLVGLALANTSQWMYVSILVLAFFAGLASPSMISLVSQFSPAEAQGEMLGLNQSMASLGRIAGPILGGNCFDWLGPHSPFTAGALLVSAAFILITTISITTHDKPTALD